MIENDTIILRAPEIEDLPVIYRWENDSSVQTVSRCSVPVSAFAIEQYILSAVQQDPLVAGQLRLMAVTKADGKVIGHLDLFNISAINRRAGIGILIDEAHRGKGYAFSILSMIIKWCGSSLGLHQLWCTINTKNEESIRLFQKAGFRQTGIRESWTRREGEWQDEAFMQLIME